MQHPSCKSKHLAILALGLLFFLVLTSSVLAQHEGHTMPGMGKAKPKLKAAPRRKAKRTSGRKAAARRAKLTKPTKVSTGAGHTGHTPGMVMSPARTSSETTASPPGKPGSVPPAVQQASPAQHDIHLPKPAGSPSATQPVSPAQHDVHVPKPGTTSTPAPAPERSDLHTPESHPSPDPSKETHDPMRHPKTDEAKPADSNLNMAGDHAMNMGPLVVMSGNEMSIRVGRSETNVMPMGQIGSGTSWQPASTQMHMLHKTSGDWLLMFHYNAVIGLNSQGGPRGVAKFESQNWFMPMALRRVRNGTLTLRSMFSFEPFTFPPEGSPLLFQTGETYKSQPLIDRQHPHDLFMELSASYTVPLGDRGTWFTYFGYPGEPALGPVAFMHRASASENPSAPLSHHLQDSSHISFGVFTTGFTYRWFKLEGSVFNGREPGENRYNFEAHPWSSRSARLSFAPNKNWSMQISHGFLRNPEALEPGDARRTTASVSYNLSFERGNWSTSIIWGRNHESHDNEVFNLNGYLAESTLNFQDKNYFYTRLELADKNQLLRQADRQLLGITEHHPSFRIGAYTFGGVRDIWATEKLSMGIGGDITLYSKPAILDAIYGNSPKSYRLFLRFRPGKMKMSGHDMSGMKH